MTESFDRYSVNNLASGPAGVPRFQVPLGVMGITSDYVDGVPSCSQTLCKAGCVRGVAGRLRGVVQAEDGYAQFGSGHRCNNSAERARARWMKSQIVRWGSV